MENHRIEIENLEEGLDKLLGAVIGLARATDGNADLVTKATDITMLEGVFQSIPSLYAHTLGHEAKCAIEELIQRITEEKKKLVPNCFFCTSSCGRNDDYDMKRL